LLSFSQVSTISCVMYSTSVMMLVEYITHEIVNVFKLRLSIIHRLHVSCICRWV